MPGSREREESRDPVATFNEAYQQRLAERERRREDMNPGGPVDLHRPPSGGSAIRPPAPPPRPPANTNTARVGDSWSRYYGGMDARDPSAAFGPATREEVVTGSVRRVITRDAQGRVLSIIDEPTGGRIEATRDVPPIENFDRDEIARGYERSGDALTEDHLRRLRELEQQARIRQTRIREVYRHVQTVLEPDRNPPPAHTTTCTLEKGCTGFCTTCRLCEQHCRCDDDATTPEFDPMNPPQRRIRL